jgi:hypothetical protein
VARHLFGGDISAWTFAVGAGNAAVLAPGLSITFWTARTGGTQITDLATAADGSGPMTQVVSGDGSTYPVGDIPVFYGPDGVYAMWASASGGPRKFITSTDAVPDMTTLSGAQTFIATKTFGPTGNVNDNRIVLMAEAVGQVGDVLVAWSGTDTGQGGARQRTTYFNEKGELRVIAAKSNSVGVRIKGQPGQTAHVLEQTDISNNPISWWEPDGSWRAPNLGQVFSFSTSGNLTVGTGQHRIYNDTGVTQIIRAVRASVGTAPTGAAVRVDVNKNGTTIFTTQANRPSIPVSQFTSGKVVNMDITTLADGDFITVDVDVIGSTIAGADLVVQVLIY